MELRERASGPLTASAYLRPDLRLEVETDAGSRAADSLLAHWAAVLRAAVAEQLLYEIRDPGSYLLPDVVCDFRHVQIAQLDAEHVRVSSALGRAPTDSFKVSATSLQGYRCTGSMVIIGIDAAAKAQRTGEAVLQRCRVLLAQAGLSDFTSSHIDLFGAETLYGEQARTSASREVMVRITASHSSRQALDLFAREIAPSGTSWSPGTTGPGAGRPSASPLIKPFAFLLPKAAVHVRVHLDGQALDGPMGLLGGGVWSPWVSHGAVPAFQDGILCFWWKAMSA
jgi:hypothetical protein